MIFDPFNSRVIMKKKQKNIEQRADDWEPEWMNPANDRKTPYTEEELKMFAENFAENMSDTQAYKDLLSEVGEENTIKVLKEQFREQDESSPMSKLHKGVKH